jgi:hypothetical protein
MGLCVRRTTGSLWPEWAHLTRDGRSLCLSGQINRADAAISRLVDAPLPFVNIELHLAVVSHFQQQGLAGFFIGEVGAFHNFVNLERLLAKRAQDIFPIIEHDWTPGVIKRAKSLGVRKLIFRDDPLHIIRLALNAVSQTSVCLDGHALNDRVNHRWIGCGASLWTLEPVANVFIQFVGI